jgi:AraC-like DNA-binding protein/uncharacterized RmlC-like cupin family protein
VSRPGSPNFTAYVDYQAFAAVHHIEAHHHNDYAELLYCIEGERRIRIGRRELRAGPGDLVVFHPAVVHEEWVQPGRYRIICLRFRAADVAGNVPFPGPAQLEPVVQLPWRERFRAIVEQIVVENNGVDHWSQVLAGTYLTQFVVLLWRALTHFKSEMQPTAADSEERVGRIIDIIHNSLNGELSLRDLARASLMSESHLSHVFKQVTGKPPKRFLIESKMTKARDLLRRTDDSVVAIAESLGYDNPQYFSRLFKKETGQAPLAYRRRQRGRGLRKRTGSGRRNA